MESREGVGGEDDLIVVLDEEFEHLGYQDDEDIGGAVDERPGYLWEGRGRSIVLPGCAEGGRHKEGRPGRAGRGKRLLMERGRHRRR